VVVVVNLYGEKDTAANNIAEALLGAVKEDGEVDLKMHAQASGINYCIHKMLGRNKIQFPKKLGYACSI